MAEDRVVVCVTRQHRSGQSDPDLVRGKLYRVVEYDVKSEAGEYMTVHPLDNHGGPDLTKPRWMFQMVDTMTRTLTIDSADYLRLLADINLLIMAVVKGDLTEIMDRTRTVASAVEKLTR